MTQQTYNLDTLTVIRAKALEAVKTKLAPLWSLENFVAVNPYMGMIDQSFLQTSALLEKLQGANTTFPKSFYIEEIKKENIKSAHLTKAFELLAGKKPERISSLLEAIVSENMANEIIPVTLFVDHYGKLQGKKWHVLMQDRITSWAAAHFDKGQAQWNTAKIEQSIFLSWKTDASYDRSTEIMGLKGFRKYVQSLPNESLASIHQSLNQLTVSNNDIEKYLHALVLKFNGWASYISGLDWDNNLSGNKSKFVDDFIAILLAWETYFCNTLKELSSPIKWEYKQENTTIEQQLLETEVGQKVLLQTAFDFANQSVLVDKINNNKTLTNHKKQSIAQALFCIDVRSEVYRRNLETVASDIETKGYAGFFGFPIKYQLAGFDKYEKNSPVLLEPKFTVTECFHNEQTEKNVIQYRHLRHFVNKAIKGFKNSAVSCFSYVSPLGLFYLPKLAMDAFGITRPAIHPQNFWLNKKTINKKDVSISGIDFESQKAMAAGMLAAAGLKKDFAPFVLIVGHGSASVNNPYASGLDCGACGGHSGEANAKLAAKVLNNPEIRAALNKDGFEIPTETVFIGCLHNTTTDEIEVYSENTEINDKTLFNSVVNKLKAASENTRLERSARFVLEKKYNSNEILKRANDWAQVRPEWGLAGCHAFVIAHRSKVKHADFSGKSFLHEYNHAEDNGLNILESIMTAPMVVTSMINLQYFASTVDNKKYGAGNKLLHNVIGGLGVIEGQAGDLKIGLPVQSVNDGTNYQHLPQRLNVFIDAPTESINSILEKHRNLKNMFDNQWLFLFAIDENGKVGKRYTQNLSWEEVEESNKKINLHRVPAL